MGSVWVEQGVAMTHDTDQAFVQGNRQGNCNVMGGTAAAHETLHGLHLKRHAV